VDAEQVAGFVSERYNVLRRGDAAISGVREIAAPDAFHMVSKGTRPEHILYPTGYDIACYSYPYLTIPWFPFYLAFQS